MTTRRTVTVHVNRDHIARLVPGLALACGIAAVAWLLGGAQRAVLDAEPIEPVVLALLLGGAMRAAYSPASAEPGIAFAAKTLLEAAIVVLGLTLDLHRIASGGLGIATAAVVTVTLATGGGIVAGQLAGLPRKDAILIAVGNAICGNSAIAAVAPAINAKREQVARAIALSAVLGLGVVLGLPLLIPVLNLSDYQFGVLAGLTVYAVPQVLATTVPVSVESGQIGALVKLTRVLLLGPVVILFATLYRHEREGSTRFSISRFIPWFMMGFIVCAILRTVGAVPDGMATDAQQVSKVATIIAMAALGLSVDLTAVRKTGGRVAIVVAGLLLGSILLALILIAGLGLDG